MAFSCREHAIHLCPHLVRWQDFTGLLLFRMCLRWQKAGAFAKQFNFLSLEGKVEQPEFAALGKLAYQEHDP